MKQRNIAIDIAKAIGILLVIIGHCKQIEYMPYRHFIFSFHMPLFFIISGYLYHRKDVKTSIMNDAKHLLIPYFVTCGVLFVWNFIYFIHTKDIYGIKWCFQASLWGSGSVHLCRWFSEVPSIGAIWFFPALFFCKNTYNCITPFCINRKLFYSSLIFLLSSLIGRYLIFIPFSLLSGLSAIIFYAIGDYLKFKTKIKFTYWIIGIICWFLSIKYSYIYIVQPRFDLYFIDVIGATTASLIVILISKKIQIIKSTRIILSWIGEKSLYILCFHLIDLNIDISSILDSRFRLNHLFSFDDNEIRFVLYRIIIPIICTWLFVKIKERHKIKNCYV